MQWLEFNFTTEHEYAEQLTTILSGIGAEGVSCVDRLELSDLFTEPLTDDVMVREFLDDLPDEVSVKAYFTARDGEFTDSLKIRVNQEFNYTELLYDDVPKCWLSLAELKALLTDQLATLQRTKLLSIKPVLDEDWADNWKQYYDINHVTERLVICPSWLSYTPKEGEVVIDLDPGSAFGTGTHETTALCLRAIDTFELQPNQRILDLGTGSGILAIALAKRAKLASARVLIEAVDVDERATQAAAENCRKNKVEVDCYTSTIDQTKQTKYDLIVANLVADIITALAEQLEQKLALTGVLLISGIIGSKREQVVEALTRQGLFLLEENEDKDWYAMLFGRKQV